VAELSFKWHNVLRKIFLQIIAENCPEDPQALGRKASGSRRELKDWGTTSPKKLAPSEEFY